MAQISSILGSEMENRAGKVILIKTELMNDYLRVDLDDQYYGSSKKDGIRCE